jgi:O-methyltransferase
MRTIYDMFPNIDNLPQYRKRDDFKDIREVEFWSVYEKYMPFTMLGVARMYECFDSVRYIARAGIAGNFVECGVFMGGCIAAIAEWGVRLGLSKRQFFLCDTFDGFPGQISETDISGAEVKLVQHPSTYAVVSDVLALTACPPDNFVLCKGPVEETLEKVKFGGLCLVRLDTDYYESTKLELILLYPQLTNGGVLIIDDYGHFEGARRATDEFFADPKNVCKLHRTDYSGRSGIKIR